MSTQPGAVKTDLDRQDLVTMLDLTRETVEEYYPNGVMMLVDPGDPSSFALMTREEADTSKWGHEVSGQTYWRTLVEGSPRECVLWLLDQVRRDHVTHDL